MSDRPADTVAAARARRAHAATPRVRIAAFLVGAGILGLLHVALSLLS